MIDLVVPRPELPAVLRQLLELYGPTAAAPDLQLPRPARKTVTPAPAVTR
jgi:hypothetical protein